MRSNPYTLALMRESAMAASFNPAKAAPVKTMPKLVSDFFDAMEINHGGNRARVCTGIAHRMSKEDLQEAIRRLRADQQERGDFIKSLNAPEVIITNEHKRHQPSIRILERVLETR